MYRWSKATQTSFFKNLQNNAQIRQAGIQAGQEMAAYLKGLIQQRRAELQAGTGADRHDVLTRLLQTSFAAGLGFSETELVSNVSALLVRLPGGSPALASSYWALAMKEAYGSCGLEYVEDLEKLKNDYGFAQAKHPMIGNPCSRTLYDPLKTANLPGNVWIRGAIVQGGDIRPPLGIEIKIQGKQILAVRTE